MKKNLLITHVDLDGISPIILLNLTGMDFDYKTIDIEEIPETFKELFETNYSEYEHVYITDLSIPDSIYKEIIEKGYNNFTVFDHHESHLYGNNYPFVTVKVDIDGVQTCGTELFYNYLKDIYPELNKPIVKEYVDLVRELDTYNFTSDLPKQVDFIRSALGKKEFIKSITKRLKKDKEHFELTAFEKRFVKLKKDEQQRYMLRKEHDMKVYKIDNKVVGVVFAEAHKSEMGNFLSDRHPDLDLIAIVDASGGVSYRTSRNDVEVNTFAASYGGGGHRKASGSSFKDEMRQKIIEEYFNKPELIEDYDLTVKED